MERPVRPAVSALQHDHTEQRSDLRPRTGAPGPGSHHPARWPGPGCARSTFPVVDVRKVGASGPGTGTKGRSRARQHERRAAMCAPIALVSRIPSTVQEEGGRRVRLSRSEQAPHMRSRPDSPAALTSAALTSRRSPCTTGVRERGAAAADRFTPARWTVTGVAASMAVAQCTIGRCQRRQADRPTDPQATDRHAANSCPARACPHARPTERYALDCIRTPDRP
jgi:hypothetical protein